MRFCDHLTSLHVFGIGLQWQSIEQVMSIPDSLNGTFQLQDKSYGTGSFLWLEHLLWRWSAYPPIQDRGFQSLPIKIVWLMAIKRFQPHTVLVLRGMFCQWIFLVTRRPYSRWKQPDCKVTLTTRNQSGNNVTSLWLSPGVQRNRTRVHSIPNVLWESVVDPHYMNSTVREMYLVLTALSNPVGLRRRDQSLQKAIKAADYCLKTFSTSFVQLHFNYPKWGTSQE